MKDTCPYLFWGLELWAVTFSFLHTSFVVAVNSRVSPNPVPITYWLYIFCMYRNISVGNLIWFFICSRHTYNVISTIILTSIFYPLHRTASFYTYCVCAYFTTKRQRWVNKSIKKCIKEWIIHIVKLAPQYVLFLSWLIWFSSSLIFYVFFLSSISNVVIISFISFCCKWNWWIISMWRDSNRSSISYRSSWTPEVSIPLERESVGFDCGCGGVMIAFGGGIYSKDAGLRRGGCVVLGGRFDVEELSTGGFV